MKFSDNLAKGSCPDSELLSCREPDINIWTKAPFRVPEYNEKINEEVQ